MVEEGISVKLLSSSWIQENSFVGLVRLDSTIFTAAVVAFHQDTNNVKLQLLTERLPEAALTLADRSGAFHFCLFRAQCWILTTPHREGQPGRKCYSTDVVSGSDFQLVLPSRRSSWPAIQYSCCSIVSVSMGNQ